MKKRAGFSLIELMVVIVVIGILAAIAVPLYTSRVAQSRSSDGAAALALVKAKQEVFRSTHFRYANTLDELPGYDSDPADYGNYYRVTIDSATANTFRAVASDAQDAVGRKAAGADVWFITESTKEAVHESKGW